MSRPRIVKHGSTWRVMYGTHMAGAWGTWWRAWVHARRIAEKPARTRFDDDITRIQAALTRMENQCE